jgi:hypothetical protein
MKTQEFLELLENNGNKELVFEYRDNEFVPKAYHITEIKSQHIESVDCGGVAHSYDETVVQLWISGSEEKDRYMEAEKALKIFNIVNGKRPLTLDTPIFFEWGYGELATSTYKVESVEVGEEQVLVKLFVPPTVCKPRELVDTVKSGMIEIASGGGCGVGSKCC